jgi:uncharacterized protein (DUF4415 family)
MMELKKTRTKMPQRAGGKKKKAPVTDWEAFDRLTDEEVVRGAEADPDARPLDDEAWADAKLIMPKTKTPVSIRVDDDVLHWFRSFGPGYQTKMNTVLRAYMDAFRKQRG